MAAEVLQTGEGTAMARRGRWALLQAGTPAAALALLVALAVSRFVGAAEATVGPRAVLPNGMTVELIGVGNGATTAKQWWRADGSPLPAGPYAESEPLPDPGRRVSREFAFRLTGGGADTTFVCCRSGPFESKTGAGELAPAVQIRPGAPPGVRAFSTTVWLPQGAATTLCLGVGGGAGDWLTLFEFDGRGTFSAASMMDYGLSAAPASDGPAGVALLLAHNVWDLDWRFVATAAQGEAVTADLTGANLGHGRQRLTARFPGKRLRDLAGFSLQVRPLQWLEFRNVAVQPGQAASPQVVPEEGRFVPENRLQHFLERSRGGMVETPEPELLTPLLFCLRSTRVPKLQTVAQLGRLGPAATIAVPLLQPLLADPDPRLGIETRVALALITQDVGVQMEPLMGVALDERVAPAFRMDAVEALGRLGAAAVPALAQLARRAEMAAFRQAVTKALAEAGGAPAPAAAEGPLPGWGESFSGGLRGRLVLARGRGPYRLGEAIPVALEVRNFGGEPVTLSYAKPLLRWWAPTVYAADGPEMPVWQPGVQMGWGLPEVLLAPNQSQALDEGEFVVRPVGWEGQIALATVFAGPGTYTLRYTVQSHGDRREMRMLASRPGSVMRRACLHVMPTAAVEIEIAEAEAPIAVATVAPLDTMGSPQDQRAVLHLLGDSMRQNFFSVRMVDRCCDTSDLDRAAWEWRCKALEPGAIGYLAHIASTHPTADYREAACEGLGYTGKAEAATALVQALHDTSAGVRRHAARCLERFRSESHVPVLLEVLRSDPDTEVRASAVFALGNIGSPKALSGLLAAQQEEKDAHLQDALKHAVRCLEQRTARPQDAGAAPAK